MPETPEPEDPQPTPAPWTAPSGTPSTAPQQPEPPTQQQPEQPQPPAPPTAPYAAGAVPPPARRGLPVPAILGIVGGGLLLLFLIVLGIALAITLTIGHRVSAAGPSAAAATKDASAAVRGYLTAVAASDATKATAYLSDLDGGTSSALTTSSVLQESNRLAPISHIVVGKPSNSSDFPDVTATYRMGTRDVSTSFHLTTDEDGNFRIAYGLGTLRAYSLQGLDVTIDGVKTTIPEDGLAVFPGTYQVTIANSVLAIDGDSQVQVTGSSDTASSESLQPKLSDSGRATFDKLVQDAVKKCLAQRTLAAGCGLTLVKRTDNGITLDEGSIRRSSTSELRSKLSHLEPKPDLQTPLLVSASIYEAPDVTATGSQNGSHGSVKLYLGPSIETAYVDFSDPTPTVRWQ